MKGGSFEIAVVGSMLLVIAGCGDGDKSPVGPEGSLRMRFDLQTLGPTPYPADNPPFLERIALGRLLFFDPILSGEMDTSCGTCHHPDFAFADGRQFGAGASGSGLGPERVVSHSALSGEPVELEPRNVPTVFNAAFNADETGQPSSRGFQFLDGRVRGLEEQAWRPLSSRAEMRGDAFLFSDPAVFANPSCSAPCHTRYGSGQGRGAAPEQTTAAQAGIDFVKEHEAILAHVRFTTYSNTTADSVLRRLRSLPEYAELFREAFPEEAIQVEGAALIDSSTYVRAVAAYVRELVTRDSAYDRYVLGDDHALNAVQKKGLELFFTKAKCAKCHRGPMFSDYRFVVTGVPQVGPGKRIVPGDDTGREEATRNPADRYAFRTLTLRNVELTAPYMHDGVFETLEEVVRFYNDGARPRHHAITDEMLDPILVEPLGLIDEEIAAIVDFMKALTDPGKALGPSLLAVPERVPSDLVPIFGVKGAGAGK